MQRVCSLAVFFRFCCCGCLCERISSIIRARCVRCSGAGDKDVVLEKCPPKLYSLEGSDGWKLQKEGTLKKSDILDDDVMCIFTGTALYVTVGDKAPSSERRSCMVEADNFLMAHRPRGHARSTIPVTRIQVPGGRGATEARQHGLALLHCVTVLSNCCLRCLIAVQDGGYLACFGETVDHHGWLSKRVGVRPLFKRHFAELVGKVLTLYTDDSKSKEDTVINLEDCESAQRSVAPRSGAEELELVCKERTYRMKCDDAEELVRLALPARRPSIARGLFFAIRQSACITSRCSSLLAPLGSQAVLGYS